MVWRVMVSSSHHRTQGEGNSYKSGPLLGQVKFYSLLEGADLDGVSQTAGSWKRTTNPLTRNRVFLGSICWWLIPVSRSNTVCIQALI